MREFNITNFIRVKIVRININRIDVPNNWDHHIFVKRAVMGGKKL